MNTISRRPGITFKVDVAGEGATAALMMREYLNEVG